MKRIKDMARRFASAVTQSVAPASASFASQRFTAGHSRPQRKPHIVHQDPFWTKWSDGTVLPVIAGGAPDDDEEGEGGTATKTAAEKELGEKADKLRGDLLGRLKEMTEDRPSGEDKGEVEKREKELGEVVDQLRELESTRQSDEVKRFESEFTERLKGLEDAIDAFGRQAARGPHGAQKKVVKAGDAYDGENYFLDLKAGAKSVKTAERIADHEEKFASAERQKAWATGDLEDVDLIVPEVQDALPYLQAEAKVVRLFREIRTSSPAVEFPVFTSGLEVGHHDDQGDNPPDKPASDPTFDLKVARVFTIAGLSEVPNSTLEDFPAARGWISTELGRATGIQENRDVLVGDGDEEPLGILSNEDIPTRDIDVIADASAGRKIITSIFRGAQQVRATGHTEPTDVVLNPAVWTDIALSFEDSIGFLYGPVNSNSDGAPAGQPPARVMGLPVTWDSYIPLDEGAGDDESPVIVGNFNDGIVLRRSPFRIDIDTSVGFKKNRTWFRGEERMGFIVVRPKSFVIVEGIKPSPVE